MKQTEKSKLNDSDYWNVGERMKMGNKKKKSAHLKPKDKIETKSSQVQEDKANWNARCGLQWVTDV